MNNKDEEVFLRYIKGVNPIKKKDRIKKEIKKTPKILINKKAETEKKELIIDKNIKKINPPQFSIEVGNTNKLLRKGQIPFDKKIDFHGKTLLQAEDEFKKTIVENYHQNKRCLLFITGKGLHKKKNFVGDNFENSPKLFYGKIRTAFLQWVKKTELSKYILTTEKTNISRGGDGAFYVYLRKKRSLDF